jgi:putative DNA primase/helicase
MLTAFKETALLHLLRACTPGTGKSYLVHMACALATRNRFQVITLSAGEEENRKALGAMLLAGMPVISIDNVKAEHPLGGDMLCQATERPLVRVRILGKSETPDIECRAAVLATGNNAKVVGDMTRRAVICNLDADTERPELL